MDQDSEFHSNSASELEFLVRGGGENKNNSENVVCSEIMTRVYEAIKLKNFNLVKLLLKQEEDAETPVQSSGPLNGYTALHIACMEGCHDLVRSLIFEFKANPNKMALDGARPIMLAVLFQHHDIVELLLDAGADANEVINDDLRKKYKSCFSSPGDEWCCDFRSKMTPVAYAILHNRIDLVDLLIRHNADFKIRSYLNKTLLMCTVHNHQERIVKSLIKVMSNDDINARDNDGFTAIHYLVKIDIRKCKCAETLLSLNKKKVRIMYILYRHGADINYMINGDPATLLINMAAQQRVYLMVEKLLLLPICFENSKPFFYFARKGNNPEFPRDINRCCRRALRDSKVSTLEGIIVDIRIRQRLNLPVLKEELLVMEDQIKEIPKLKTVILKLTEPMLDEIFEIIKRQLIEFDDQRMSIYDILTSSNRKFAQLVSDESFYTALKLKCSKNKKTRYYFHIIALRRFETMRRMKLLNECKNILYDISKTFHSIPFYCVLEIVDYLPYNDFKNFAVAFGLREIEENNETVLII